MFGGRNMGRGGGGGGGSLLRSVGRAVTRVANTNTTNTNHLQEPSSSSSSRNSNINHLPVSSPFASCNLPVSTVYGVGLPTWQRCDDLDWVSVENETYFAHDVVPSEDEVHCAVSALQQVFSQDSYSSLVRDKFDSELAENEEYQVTNPSDFSRHVSPPGSELDWIEPSLCMCNSRITQSYGSERVYDALRLLRTEPLVQNMVKSLSSDEAVWNAVLNNSAVRELRESLSADDNGTKSQEENKDNSIEEVNIVRRVFDGTRAKLMEVVDKITKLVSDLFQHHEDGKTSATGGTDTFMEKLRTSFMLSVMVLLVVVVARAHKA